MPVSECVSPQQEAPELKLEKRFTYHPPNENQITAYEIVRGEANRLAKHLVHFCPDCRELSLALTKLEEMVMWANAAIARRS